MLCSNSPRRIFRELSNKGRRNGTMKFGVIGFGNMGGAIVRGALKKGTLKKEDVTPPYLSHFRYHHKLFILPLQCL